MPQSTNLNVSPYYDDFNEDNNYHKVLFKPGVTVQTRELNNLQSILQNQIEKFGSKFFTNGGIVIPGNFAYDGTFNCIEIESTYKGTSVETYFENFIGKRISGKLSGVTAKVDYVLSSTDAESTKNTTALYVKYLSSASEDFTTEVFSDGEELVLNEEVTVGTTVFAEGTSLFRVLSPTNSTASSVGSAAKIESGVYFIRGSFVNISKDTIILDAYTNTPSYRVGLKVIESIVDSDEDRNLVDNARGFSNYAAPGADRLKIEAILTKKDLDDYNDDDFIELFRVKNGILNKINQNDPYAFITEVLARRTYDESGNYYVEPFKVSALESLNDNLGNGGQYLSGENTDDGSVASDDLAVLKVNPGKAYVKGYEISTPTTILDYPKPRTTKSVESSSSNFRAGNLLRVNNVDSIPQIGITTSSSISLYSTRLNASHLPTAGDKIGVAKIYDYEYHNDSYVDATSQSNVYLFDIQTYTKLTTSSSISGISTGDYIRGEYSNASGYVKEHSGTTVKLYQVSGTFVKNEGLSICGIGTTTTIASVIDYSIQDIKSISDATNTFTADSFLGDIKFIEGPFDIAVSSGIATISRQDGTSFANGFKVNDIISYSISGADLPVYSRITSITQNKTLTLSLETTVTGICTNTLGSSGSLSSINLIRPEIKNYNDSSFYAPLENANVSEVGFSNSSIFVKRYYTGLTITDNSITLPSLVSTDFVYAPFDEERYCLIDSSDGTNIPLTEDNLTIETGGKTATLTSLSIASGTAALISTQIKSNISSKYKKLNRCASVSISRTKYSEVPTGSGLTYSRVYGTRVEDQELSLNYPDIFKVHGVFQSSTSASPQLPTLTISGVNTSNINIGELFIGQTSGAVAICAEVPSSSTVSFVYKSDNKFVVGEKIDFKETDNTATVTYVTIGEPNIISEFLVDNGQREYFYDIGRLIRKTSGNVQSKKIKIVFDYFNFETTDYGDVISVNSYPSNTYGKDIPVFDNSRNTDVIDIRPRVSDYNTASTLSPFEYGSRNFTLQYNNSSQILKSNESIIFDFKYYLPRIDRLTLDKTGKFEIVLGEPGDNPISPSISNEVLDVAKIIPLPYVYNVQSDIEIQLTDNRRFTMSDIRDIEKRVDDLEYYTALSLLEVSTQNLLIEDSDGFNRFKCGFFVDNFSTYEVSDYTNSQFNAKIDKKTLSADIEKVELSLELSSSAKLKTTGTTLSLDYSQEEYQKQPFASRIVNINPFNIVTWGGNLSLSPKIDRWSIFINREQNKWGHHEDETEVNTVPIRYMRSRNIGFTASRLKPSTQFDFLFDSKNLSNNNLGSTYAFPKLIEVSNVNGSFSIGETVSGYDTNGNIISFRLCSPNHKYGPYNAPTYTYTKNPYNTSAGLSTSYGPESTVLNIDTETLSVSQSGSFFGNITKGMKLYGNSSKAFATVSDVKLVSDDNGSLIGAFFIPNPSTSNVRYETGTTTAKITTTAPAVGVPGEVISSAESTFTSDGNVVTITRITWADPLAQTFNVEEEDGVFITSVDVFFQSKDSKIPVELQIREVTSGIPGGPDKVVGNLTKVLNPSDISISNDGLTATTFTFDNLTRLEGGKEYAVVLISDSDSYNVWISRMGEVDISTASLPDVQKVIINKQPSLGSLFKSQNGTTWVPTAEEDLKFTLRRAKFALEGGSALLTNPIVTTKSLGNKLPNNPITGISTLGESPYNDGRYIKVYHPNHGMYSENNFVEILGVEPDSLPVNLDSELLSTSTGPITLSSITTFSSFNGSAVDNISNPGYIKINEEIIKYTASGSGQLTGITRGQFGTTPVTHPLNSKVYKYEFNGVSLAEINKVYEGIIDPTIDHYYVKISDSNPIFASTKSAGGSNVYASKNIQFGMLSLDDSLASTYKSTSLTASIRTVSSTSVNGSETSFSDNGYESIDMVGTNKFNSPRMICSRVNETEYLPQSQFDGNRSFTLELKLNSSSDYNSPIINLENVNVFAENYIINQPINSNEYPTDSRVNSNVNDPNKFIYISKRIDLTTAATSLKVLLSAFRHSSSDIRVLYKIFRNDSTNEDQNWELFPGYLNLDVNNNVKDTDNNDGRPDTMVPESLKGEYRDYTFTVDNLASFTGYAIKIVGTTNNQAYSPIIKDLRAIALK